MKRDRIVDIGLGRFPKLLRYLSFSFRLGLHRHGILQGWGNQHILDLAQHTAVIATLDMPAAQRDIVESDA